MVYLELLGEERELLIQNILSILIYFFKYIYLKNAYMYILRYTVRNFYCNFQKFGSFYPTKMCYK